MSSPTGLVDTEDHSSCDWRAQREGASAPERAAKALISRPSNSAGYCPDETVTGKTYSPRSRPSDRRDTVRQRNVSTMTCGAGRVAIHRPCAYALTTRV